jgi:hypothetical protein
MQAEERKRKVAHRGAYSLIKRFASGYISGLLPTNPGNIQECWKQSELSILPEKLANQAVRRSDEMA